MLAKARGVIDPVLLVALGALFGPALAVAPTTTSFAAILIAAIVRARASRAAILMALVALAMSGLRARAALNSADVTYDAAVELAKPPARCVAEALVVHSPVAEHSSEGAQASADVELVSGTCDERPITRPLRARVHAMPLDAARGDRFELYADLAVLHRFDDEGSPDARARIARSGVALSGSAVEARRISEGSGVLHAIDRARSHVRARITATFHATAEPLARALVLGESELSPDDDTAFRESGLSHLLAVSGTHLVIAVLGVVAALGALLSRVEALAARMDARRIAAGLGAILAWIYADFAGGSGSAVRAAAMLSVQLLAIAIGRRGDGVRALSWSLLGLTLFDPLVLTDVSFALSVAATAGLLALGKPLGERLGPGEGVRASLGRALGTTLAAMAGCAPVLATMAPSLPLLGLVANLIAAPLGELAALPICLVHAALSPWASAERGAAILGSGALIGVRAVARWTSHFGLLVPVPDPTPTQLATLAVLIAALYAWPSQRRRVTMLGALALVVGEVIARREGAPTGGLRVTALDVGQGDSTLLDLPDGRAMLIDGGGFIGSPIDPGARVILPLLRARRRSRIDVIVLTHPHPDHFTGLLEVIRRVPVGELWDTGQGEADGAGATYAELLAEARARGVIIRRPAELCDARDVGGARVEVLAPCPGFNPDRGANDNSLVLRVVFGKRAALFVGDAEREAERTLLESGAELRADFLKVGHHGSRTSSSPDFLARVRPSVATISTGVRNRFGHPNPVALSSLFSAGIDVHRTDREGAITWWTDGDRVSVRAMRRANKP